MRSIVEVMKRKAQVPAEKNRPKMFDEFRISTFIILTIAGIINAFGVTIFLFPVKLYDSGISGLSMLLDQITPPQFTLSLFLLLLNIPIFAFGYKKQGASFTIYSVFTVGVYSVMSFLIMNVLPIDVSFISPLAGSDLLLCAIFGGVISGIGSGLTIRFGGAIDGIDVCHFRRGHIGNRQRSDNTVRRGNRRYRRAFGCIFQENRHIYRYICHDSNTILYTVCGITIKSWILPLYSIVTYYIGSKTVDFVVEGIDKSLFRIFLK